MATKQRRLRAVQGGADAGADERDALAWIPDEPAAISAEVRQLAGDLIASGTDLSAADKAALVTYFNAGARMLALAEMMTKAGHDAAMWLRMAAQVDKDAALQRALLRDLRLTRSAQAQSSTAARAKAAGKSGGQWKGLL